MAMSSITMTVAMLMDTIMIIDDFLIYALLAGLSLAFVSGPLGCVIVWRRMAYFGDTLSHAALLGIAIAISSDVLPMIGVATIGCLLATLLFLLERNKQLSTDTLLGILSHSALALGLIVISLVQASGKSVNLMAYLFGDILAVNDDELIWMAVVVVAVLTVFAYLWRSLLSISAHEDLARVDGVNVERTLFMFMLLLALVVAVAIKVVGILLITAMLIIPAACARLYSASPKQMIALSVLFSMLSVVIGLGSSLSWDIPTGPSIVISSAVLFFGSKLLRVRVGH